MQLALAAIGGPQADSDWLRLKERLLSAITLITPKELCWRLGIKEQYLSDAIAERDRKTIKASWIPVILAMAPDSARQAILEELASGCGFDVRRKKILTAEEKNARWEERVQQEFGAAGARLIEEMRR